MELSKQGVIETSLTENIVAPSAFSIHRGGNLGLLQHGDEVNGRELRILIGVEDVWLAVTGQCFLDSFDATVCFPSWIIFIVDDMRYFENCFR